MTPRAAFDSRDKARPTAAKIIRGQGVRVRQDRIDKSGHLSLRHAGKLHHIGIGRDHKGKSVIMLIKGLEIRVITREGDLLRELTLDTSKLYHGTGRPPGPPKGRPMPNRRKKPSTMS